MPWTNGCSSAASARTRFRCHNESQARPPTKPKPPHYLATASVDDPNRNQRSDPWIEPDRQSVGRGDDMTAGVSVPLLIRAACPQIAHNLPTVTDISGDLW